MIRLTKSLHKTENHLSTLNLLPFIMKNKFRYQIIAMLLVIIFSEKTFAENNVPNAKTGTITGRIIEASSNKPMEFVSISLYTHADSVFKTGTISNQKGEFKLDKIAFGSYYLSISFMGFDKTLSMPFELSDKNSTVNIGSLKMYEQSSQLKEVEITAEKSRVEYQIDKRVINVDKDIVARGGSAVNVLENTPSIQVDPQGNVTLRGSSDYIVLIDGKQTILKGSDALKQINAATIEQIEVITNPSARYEANAQSGIINVILKKEKLQGLSGTIYTTKGFPNKNSANVLLNYRKSKINVFGGVDFENNKYKNEITIDNISYLPGGVQHFKSYALQYFYSDNLMGKLGMDYDMDAKNSFTLQGSYGEKGFDQGTDSEYNYYWEGNNQQVYSKSSNALDVMGKVAEVSLDFQHKFGTNHTLSISNNYVSWDGQDNNLLTENLSDNMYNNIKTIKMINFVKDNFNYNYRFNIDYKREFKIGTHETGFQYRYEDRDDDVRFRDFDTTSALWIPNPLFTSKLDYVNDIYSGYATFASKIWGIGYMLGLRSEYFTRSIVFSNDGDTYNFDKFMLYPSVHLSRSFKDKHQFQLSYSRRINRPQPYLLNKTPAYIDPYNIFKGSPTIEPEYTDAFELNYRFMYKIMTISTQTYYRLTTNSFSSLRILDNTGIMTHQLINSNNQTAYGIELGLDFNLNKWWQINSGGNFYRYNIESYVNNSTTNNKANSWDARLISNFTVLKTATRIQAVGYVRGSGIDAQGNSTGFYTVNLALNQPLLKGKLNLGVSGQNIFNSIKYHYTVKSDKYNNDYLLQSEGPVILFTASISFNNFRDKQRGRSDDANFRGGGAF